MPGTAMDIPNIGALSFAKAVSDVVEESLEDSESYEAFYGIVRQKIWQQAEELCEKTKGVYLFPAPFLSLMMEGCCENGRDISRGAKYNNYGFHGSGFATAEDSLAV